MNCEHCGTGPIPEDNIDRVCAYQVDADTCLPNYTNCPTCNCCDDCRNSCHNQLIIERNMEHNIITSEEKQMLASLYKAYQNMYDGPLTDEQLDDVYISEIRDYTAEKTASKDAEIATLRKMVTNCTSLLQGFPIGEPSDFGIGGKHHDWYCKRCDLLESFGMLGAGILGWRQTKDERIKQLEAWKKEQIACFAPLLDYGQSAESGIGLGKSIVTEAIAALKSQKEKDERIKELERLLSIEAKERKYYSDECEKLTNIIQDKDARIAQLEKDANTMYEKMNGKIQFEKNKNKKLLAKVEKLEKDLRETNDMASLMYGRRFKSERDQAFDLLERWHSGENSFSLGSLTEELLSSREKKKHSSEPCKHINVSGTVCTDCGEFVPEKDGQEIIAVYILTNNLGMNPVYCDTPKDISDWISNDDSGRLGDQNGLIYSVQITEMTRTEFNNLPEWEE